MIFFQHDTIKIPSKGFPVLTAHRSFHFTYPFNIIKRSCQATSFSSSVCRISLTSFTMPTHPAPERKNFFSKPPRLPYMRHEKGDNFPGLVAFTGHDHLDSLSTILMEVDRDYTNKFTSSKLRRCGRAQVSEMSRWWVLNNKAVECFCDLLYDQANHSGACSSQGIAWHNCAPMLEREKPNNAWWGVTHLK